MSSQRDDFRKTKNTCLLSPSLINEAFQIFNRAALRGKQSFLNSKKFFNLQIKN